MNGGGGGGGGGGGESEKTSLKKNKTALIGLDKQI